MGNHEHWNGIVTEDLILAKALADRSGITLLDGTNAGCRFIGTTLWSDYQLAGQFDPATPTGEAVDASHDEKSGHHGLTTGDAAAPHCHVPTLDISVYNSDSVLDAGCRRVGLVPRYRLSWD